MQKIVIDNFGPIEHIDLEIKDLLLFIGEQATGKSTVAKLVYFFKSLRSVLLSILYEDFSGEKDIHNSFIDKAAFKFLNLSLRPNNFPHSDIIYKYRDGLFVRLRSSQKRVIGINYFDSEDLTFDNNAYNGLFAIFDKIQEYKDKYFTTEKSLKSSAEYRETETEKKKDAHHIELQINDFFGDNKEVFFIPASRSLLATLSEQSSSIAYEGIMQEFIKNINRLKPAFQAPFQEIIAQRKLQGNHIASDSTMELVQLIIKEVLKGEYRIDNLGNEKIYFDENNSIKLSFASSGQQEAVWILLQLFALILNRERVFLVIEEPEAHLFPKAQKAIVDLITILFKENKNQVIVTTHSPYILTSFNNLIFAGNVGKKEPEEASKIIPERLWINSEDVGAYQLKDGKAENLIDEEVQLIQVEEIDTVSQNINETFDSLFNLEP